MIKTHGLDMDAAQSVEAAAEYLVNNTHLLHYDRALADGLPIATGVIEGAFRYLVNDRMGRTAAVWSVKRAEAVLRLRALRASGDFDDYWPFHLEKEHERTHRSRYADGDVPNPLPPSRSRPRLRPGRPHRRVCVVIPNVLPLKCASAVTEADAGCHGWFGTMAGG